VPRDADVGERFVEGDRVVDPHGNQGFARRHTNRQTGERFWGVVLTDGPDKRAGKIWGRASDFTPVLGHDDGQVRAVCVSCARPFLSPARVLEGGHVIEKYAYCRTCLPKGRREDASRASESYIGSEYHKTEHHNRDDGSGSPF